MKKVLLLSCFLVSISVFGQKTKLSPSDISYFYEKTLYLKKELPDGYYRVYFDEKKSQLAYEGEIKNKLREGLWKKYDSEGTLIVKCRYSKGQYSGSFKKYYSNGQLKFKAEFMSGFPDGFAMEWFENGIKKSEGTYSDGAKTGVWRFWDDTGGLLPEMSFEKGMEVDN